MAKFALLLALALAVVCGASAAPKSLFNCECA